MHKRLLSKMLKNLTAPELILCPLNNKFHVKAIKKANTLQVIYVSIQCIFPTPCLFDVDSYEDDPDTPGKKRLCSSSVTPPLQINVTEEELRLLRSVQLFESTFLFPPSSSL